jgi:hypothetical protein
MPEEKKPLKSFSIDYICDVCGKGHMRPTGVVYERMPPLFVHECDKCGQGMNLDHHYPYVRHE